MLPSLTHSSTIFFPLRSAPVAHPACATARPAARLTLHQQPAASIAAGAAPRIDAPAGGTAGRVPSGVIVTSAWTQQPTIGGTMRGVTGARDGHRAVSVRVSERIGHVSPRTGMGALERAKRRPIAGAG